MTSTRREVLASSSATSAGTWRVRVTVSAIVRSSVARRAHGAGAMGRVAVSGRIGEPAGWCDTSKQAAPGSHQVGLPSTVPATCDHCAWLGSCPGWTRRAVLLYCRVSRKERVTVRRLWCERGLAHSAYEHPRRRAGRLLRKACGKAATHITAPTWRLHELGLLEKVRGR